jgi:hypothetical protein
MSGWTLVANLVDAEKFALSLKKPGTPWNLLLRILLTNPDPVNVPIGLLRMRFVPSLLAPLWTPSSGRMLFTITFGCTTSPVMVIAANPALRSAPVSYPI